jgi:uncharacterized protein (TIGR00730 family)
MRICLFCGSSEGIHPAYSRAASNFGTAVATGGHTLVYGGGRVGLMGVAADAALAGGAEVVGVIPHGLADKELAHQGLTELHVVDTMHQRKFLMSEGADAFVVLPGGAGTHDEFFEMWTWVQIGVHDKPIGFLNVRGFFDPLFAYIDHLIGEGFLAERFRHTLTLTDNTSDLFERLGRYEGTPAKWSQP